MNDGKPVILVFGAQRLWRQALKNVLESMVGADAVQEQAELRMDALRALTPFDWAIAFLPSRNKLERLVTRLSTFPLNTNVLLLSMDGTAIVRRADRTEQRYRDISLEELVRVLTKPNLR